MRAHLFRGAFLAVAIGLAAGCAGDAEGEKKVTPSGARYVDLVEGEGEPAKFGDGLHFAYVGYLADGRTFEKHGRDNPAALRLGWNQPIIGLDEGLEKMKAGGKRRIWVPAKAGYGVRGSPPGVPPNADLIFDVDLIKVVTSDQARSMEEASAKQQKEFAKAAESAAKKRAEEAKKPPTGKEIPVDERREVKTPTGLKYTDEKVGDGREAVPGAKVWVLYEGRLTSGSLFDRTKDSTSPFHFEIGAGNVIKGWDEGVAGMKVGGKRKLVIPPDLGYGERGAGNGTIPPNATLIFEIELLAIQ
jgi:FKBP-type peptidyl-prolyl cis-trans isomerase